MSMTTVRFDPALPLNVTVSRNIASLTTFVNYYLANSSNADDVAASRSALPFDRYHGYKRRNFFVTFAIALAIIAIIVTTSVANFLAFLVFITRGNKRRSKNIYLANLSVIDFFIGLFVMPTRMMILLNPSWSLSHSYCRVFLTFTHCLVYASLLGVVLVSFDRWYSICYPFTYRVRPNLRIALISVIVIWVFSAIIHIPLIGFTDKIFDSSWPELASGPCQISPKQHPFTVIFFTILRYVVPHLTMFILKCSLYRKIRQRQTANVRRSFGSFDSGALALIRTSISESAMNTLIEASNNSNNGSISGNGFLSTPSGNSTRKCSRLTRRNTMELMTIRQDSSRCSRSWSGSPDQRSSLSVPVLGRRMSLQDFMIPSNMRSQAGRHHFGGRDNRRETVGDLAKNLLDKQDSKAAWYLSLLLTVSLLCWTPWTLFYIAEVFVICPVWANDLVVWTLLINSTANPFLYGLLNKEFRKVLCSWFSVRSGKMKRLQLALRLLSFQMALGAIDFQDSTKEEVDTSVGIGLTVCQEGKES